VSTVLSQQYLRSKDSEGFEQRNNANHDHDHPDDLFSPAINRQHVDKVEDENDYQECDQNSDDGIHAFSLSEG
jgi:hypothetical protein